MEMNASTALTIVGAGPVGATMALLMAKRGHRVLLVDKKAGPCEHPAAHMIHSRTLEIFEEIEPAIIEAANARGAPIDEICEVLWCTSLQGIALGSCSAVPEDAEELERYHAHSPHRSLHLPQHRLEPILYAEIAREPKIEFLRRTEWIGYEEDGERVISTFRRADGSEFMRETRFLIGADGAWSAVRSEAKIAMEGPAFQHLMSVFFQAKLEKPRPGVLFWVINPALIGVLVHHLADDWVLMIPYHPPVEQKGDFSEADYVRFIRAALGAPELEPHIKVVGSWVMSSAIAEHYRAGSVFLIGDAAHRFPPTGGFGANTGVQDAHNLAWKLDAHLRGKASEWLLDTYEIERRPIAIANAEQSRVNHEMTAEMTRALGLDPGAAERLLSSLLFKLLPRVIKRAALRGGQRLALRSLAQLSNEGGEADALRARLSEALELQRDHFLTRGQELGFHYREGFLIPSPSPKPQIDDGIREYLPVAYPGARFPHFRVERDGAPCSSHALLDRAGLTILVSARVRTIVEALIARSTTSLPLSGAFWGEEPGAFRILDQALFDNLGLNETDALILRPDGHIAAKITAAPSTLETELRSALRSLNLVQAAPVLRGV